MNPFMNLVKIKDPLVLCDTNSTKSPALQKGISALSTANHVFRPSLWSMHWLTRGNSQTMMLTSVKDYVQTKRKGRLEYSFREKYQFKNGG